MSHRRKPKKVKPEPVVATKPVAQRFATYKGDATHMAAKGEVVGPNTMGEHMTAVTAHYDAETDRTRVGFAFGVLLEA